MNSPVQFVATNPTNRYGAARSAKNWTHTVFRIAAVLMLASLVSAASVNKTVLDLMVEGRYGEAQTLIADNSAGARYAAMLEAMTEADAPKACALYRSVSERFPGTDCDSLAQERLLLALDAGVSIAPEEEQYEPPVEFTEEKPQPEETPTDDVAVIDDTQEIPVAEIAKEVTEEVEEMTEEPSAEQRTMLSSVQKPEAVSTSIPDVTPGSETSKTTTGITVDYQDESKTEATGIQQAAATQEKSIVAANDMPTEATPDPLEESGELALLETNKPGVKPQPLETIPHDVDVPVNRSGDWFIQVGAFGNHDNALRLAAKLRSAGYPVVLVPRETDSGTLMQVRVGGYETRDSGKQIAGKLKSEFDIPAVLVSK